MQILAQYTLTANEALRGTRAFKRLWYAISMGSGALLMLMGKVTFQASQGGHKLGLYMVFNGLLFLVLPEAVLRWARLRRGSQAYPPTEVTLNDEGLTLRTESSEGSLTWASFTSIQRHTGFWFFRISRSQAVIVPERAVNDTSSAELTSFLRERKLMKA
jgi:YcxB-like protein